MALMKQDCEDPRLDLVAEVLRSRGTVRLRALGTSMLPSIWPGDVLSIENRPSEQMVPGDIVLIMRGSRFFVHRLVERRDGKDLYRWITRGDALPRNDPPAETPELLGRVSGIRRGTHMIIPRRRISLLTRMLAWMLCHCDQFRNVALRIYSSWQNRRDRVRADVSFRGVRDRVPGLSTVSCGSGANEGSQQDASY